MGIFAVNRGNSDFAPLVTNFVPLHLKECMAAGLLLSSISAGDKRMKIEVQRIEYEVNWHAIRCLTGAMMVSCAMWGGIIRGVLALVK